MEKNCSFVGIGSICCGESRGLNKISSLFDCQEDITSQLTSCHLSKSNLKEYELIAARAGMFHLTDDQIQKMTICPSHRHNLGRYWRSLRSCQYPIHSGPVRKCAGRDVFNCSLSEAVLTFYGKLVQVGSPICRQCREMHKGRMKKEGAWLKPEQPTTVERIDLEKSRHLVSSITDQMHDLSLFSSPSCSSESSEQVQAWTPGCASAYISDSDQEQDDDDNDASVIRKYNQTIKSLSELAGMESPPELSFQLQNDLHSATSMEKNVCIERATDACKIICRIIAPNDGENLFQSLPRVSSSESLLPLVTAYAQAPSRNLKTQILSIYAYELPKKALQKLHEPYGKLSQWQINRARAHARTCGPGIDVKKTKYHRINLDMGKVDHFIDFANRPYFHQDVAFGTRNLKLESGEMIEMPNVVRTVTRSTMIAQYLEFCNEEEFEPLSRATLFRILEVREASQRKSLQGLDNTAADGSNGFNTMEHICERLVHLGVDMTWSQSIIKRLQRGKQYLKTDYKVHCQEDGSLCADHCRPFALSDPTDKLFQLHCSHQHTVACENCENIKSTLEELRQKLQHNQHFTYTQEIKEDLIYDFEEAYNNIQKWKAHILRSINQERAKQQVLNSLDESSILIVMDWAMKFQQIRFREKQSDWYGKRGLSWHVSSVVSKGVSTETVVVTTYVHLFDSCTQDWFSVASIVENLLSTIKSNLPLVSKAYLRSDEAGCYHNNLLVASMKDIGKRVGVSVESYDFSEPQQGKDICDRIISPLKSSIRRYCNEGHDILNAADMHTALRHRPVKGATSSINEVNESVEQLRVKKIPKFSSFHNFGFEKDGVRVWKAFGIGKGKKLSDKSFYVSHQNDTQLGVKEPFPQVNLVRQTKLSKESSVDTDGEGLFDCWEPGCNYVFKSFENLELHMDLGQHSRFINNESVYDVLRREWASNFSTLTTKNVQISKQSAALQIKKSTLKMGWALSQPKTGSVRFSESVRKYLIAKFEYGERTGHKADPTQVSLDLRSAKDESGDRLFGREEWLNKQQIKGFFSRLAKQRRKGPSDVDTVEEDSLEYESDSDEDEERELLRNDIINELNVTHPIYYDAYDLCDLHHNQKLSVFKVPMLKEICSHFELGFKSKDKKQDLIDKISDMAAQCSCCQK